MTFPFKTLGNVFEASETHLSFVDGIGPKKVSKIVQTTHGRFIPASKQKGQESTIKNMEESQIDAFPLVSSTFSETHQSEPHFLPQDQLPNSASSSLLTNDLKSNTLEGKNDSVNP